MKLIYWFMSLHLRLRKLFGAPTAGLFLIPAIPGAGIVSAVLGALAAVVRAVFEGISICVANPVVLTVVAVAFAGGVWQGIRWDLHKVEAANAKVLALQQQWKEAEDSAERRLSGAMAARKAAEDTAKMEAERAARASAAAARAAADAQRMRKLSSQPSASSPAGSGVPWFQTLFGADGAATARH